MDRLFPMSIQILVISSSDSHLVNSFHIWENPSVAFSFRSFPLIVRSCACPNEDAIRDDNEKTWSLQSMCRSLFLYSPHSVQELCLLRKAFCLCLMSMIRFDPYSFCRLPPLRSLEFHVNETDDWLGRELMNNFKKFNQSKSMGVSHIFVLLAKSTK